MDIEEKLTTELSEFIKIANRIRNNAKLLHTFEADMKFDIDQFLKCSGAQLYLGDREQTNYKNCPNFGQFLLYNAKLVALYHHPDEFHAIYRIDNLYVFVSRIYTYHRILPYRIRILIYSKKVT